MATPADGAATREWHPAFEEYCEAIFELQEDDIETIRSRIADRLGVSRPAVTEMTRKLEEADLVVVQQGRLQLTPDGRRLAEQVVRRHRLAERFLTDVLRLSWAESHHEAGKWEHVISDRVESAMIEVLGDPTTCPHGNPIPGSGYEAQAGMVTVDQLQPGDGFVVHRIPEDLEWTPGMLEFLESSGVVPGAALKLSAKGADGSASVVVGPATVSLDAGCASRILVAPQ